MRRFSKMRGEAGRLERELRAARPEPRADYLLALSKHVAESRPRHPRRLSRVAFALSLTTFVVGSFASFGGISYAASGATSAVKAVKHVVVSDQPRNLSQTSARAQYGPAPTPPTAAAAPAVQAAAAREALPFTGISLLFTAIIGSVLLCAGLLLRWREKRQS